MAESLKSPNSNKRLTVIMYCQVESDLDAKLWYNAIKMAMKEMLNVKITGSYTESFDPCCGKAEGGK